MLTPTDAQQIIQLDNLVLKNLKITQAYHELSLGMQQVIGAENVNWCTFATHASKTAGYGIRNEMLPPAVTQALVRFGDYRESVKFLSIYLENPDEALCQNGCGLVQDTLVRISRQVSVGNCRVFAELAPLFSRFILWFADDSHRDEAKLADFLAQLRPGPVEYEGQDYLIEAFTAYYAARFENDTRRTAELILLANLLVGLHEQVRLQPNIAGALHAPMEELMEKWLHRLAGSLPTRLNATLRQLILVIGRRLFAGMITNTLMVIIMPWGNLILSRDVIPVAGSSKFPADLFSLTDPRLRQLVSRLDRHLDTLTGSAAGDWASLPDRMSYIVDLFRSHQQNPRLFSSPFTTAQANYIHAGCVPAGQL